MVSTFASVSEGGHSNQNSFAMLSYDTVYYAAQNPILKEYRSISQKVLEKLIQARTKITRSNENDEFFQ